MAKQTINIGTTANDGTGDAIRAAFGKVNDNFTEIYTANTGTNTGDQNLSAYATTAAVAAGYQPLDSDLTAISALTTTAYGRALLSTADAATLRSAIGVGPTDAPTFLALTLTGQSLTGTQATSLVDLSATWNTTGTPSALKLNVTDTASNAASKLLDLQVGGVSKFNVDKTGSAVCVNATVIGLTSTFRAATGTGYLSEFASGGLGLHSAAQIAWASGFSGFGTKELLLEKDAAGILAQRNGSARQSLRIYNTYTSASIYERAVMGWNATTGYLDIGTEFLGSGMAAKQIDFVVGGTARLSILNTGVLSVASHIYVAGTVKGNLTTNTAYTGTVVTPTGYITIYDSNNTPYKVPCVA